MKKLACLLAFLSVFLFSVNVFADEYKMRAVTTLNLPMPEHYPTLVADCAACKPLVEKYNDLTDTIFDVEKEMRQDYINIDWFEKKYKNQQDYITYLKSQPDTAQNQIFIKNATMQADNYKSRQESFSEAYNKASERYYSLERYRVSLALQAVECEKKCDDKIIEDGGTVTTPQKAFKPNPLVDLTHSIPALVPLATHYCKACEGAANQYNGLVERYNRNIRMATYLGDLVDLDGEILDNDDDYLDYLDSLPDSADKTEKLAKANAQLKEDLKKKEWDNDRYQIFAKDAKDIKNEMGFYKEELDKCLKKCAANASTTVKLPPIKQSNEPMPTKLPSKTTECLDCKKVVREYNDLTDQLYNAELKLHNLREESNIVRQKIGIEGKAKEALMQQELTPEVQTKLDLIEKRLNDLVLKDADLDIQADKERTNVNKLKEALTAKAKEVSDCEKISCQSHGSVVMPTPRVEVGLLASYTNVNRTGQITSTSGGTVPGPAPTPVDAGDPAFSANSTSSTTAVGLQAKFIYSFQGTQPFIYLNGSVVPGAPTTINFGITSPASTQPSTLVVGNNWTTRLGVGIQTEPLLGGMQFGVGVGAAVINQTLKMYVPEASTSIFQTQNTSIRPTVMGSVTWPVCQSCIFGLPALLSAQLSADNYASIGVNGVTPSGTRYTGSAGQTWAPQGDLVLSVRLP